MDLIVNHADGDTFLVEVSEDGKTRTRHRVRVTGEMLERYGPGATAEELLRASFGFLLEREPPKSILATFDIEVIERYFPEYPSEVRTRLGGTG